MLKHLSIENIALLDRADLEFSPGMTVLTGETGAGKSIIVTALALVLGGRSDREYIRSGTDKGSVVAIFDISRLPAEYKKDHASLIDGDKLTVSREITIDGRSRIKIGNKTATLSQLKSAAGPIAEILGQHANQALMNEENHLDFLDDFAALRDLRQTVAGEFETWKRTTEQLARIKSKRDQLQDERELLLFQQAEIEKAEIRIGEQEELITEKNILDSARSLMTSAANIVSTLDNDEFSILEALESAQRELDKMAQTDKKLGKQSEELTDITFRLQDLKNSVEQYGATIEDDPNRIEEINLRLDEIYNLKKKYGGSEAAILESLNKINRKLADSPEDVDRYIAELEENCQRQFESYAAQALALSDTRHKAAAYLQKLVKKELSELAIDSGDFKYDFSYEDDPKGVDFNGRTVRPTANGLESGRILFSANPGEPLKSLVKTASGGEISRVLLAMKAAQTKNAHLGHSLLIFDEVDAGIGGETAVEVGKKLKKLSRTGQTLVITHLHQIARQADQHLVAQKTTSGDKKSGRTSIIVRQLDPVGIQHELARMVALPT